MRSDKTQALRFRWERRVLGGGKYRQKGSKTTFVRVQRRLENSVPFFAGFRLEMVCIVFWAFNCRHDVAMPLFTAKEGHI